MSIDKIEEELQNYTEKVNDFKKSFEEEISNEKKIKLLEKMKLVKDLFQPTRDSLDSQEHYLGESKNKILAGRKTLSDFRMNRKKEIFDFNKEIKTFYIGFNNISDLKIISSAEVIQQIEIIKEKAASLQLFLSKLILDNEAFPDIPDILPSQEMQDLLSSNNILVEIMRKELK